MVLGQSVKADGKDEADAAVVGRHQQLGTGWSPLTGQAP